MNESQALPLQSNLPNLDVSGLTAIYRQMVLIRRVEELVLRLDESAPSADKSPLNH